MFRNVIVALIFTCTGFAHAGVQTWQFKYTGFLFQPPVNGGPSIFLPDRILIGTFSGSDLDHDGLLEKSELSAFLLDNTTDYVAACPGWVSSESSLACEINSFSFDLSTRDLSFRTTSEQDGEFMSSYRYLSTDSGDQYLVFGSGSDTQELYLFVPETTLMLTNLTAPVPEPGIYAMLAGGLAVLALLRRRPGRAQQLTTT